VYGPIINVQTLSFINTSNQRMWKFLNGDMKTIEPMITSHPLWVDVRDLAHAHLSAYETQAAGGNRFFIVADELYSDQDIADAFRKVFPPILLLPTSSEPFQHFPELKDKIPEGEPGKGFNVEPGPFYTQNNARSKEILHLTYRSFESCMAGTLAPIAQDACSLFLTADTGKSLLALPEQ
jgi:nucleoside-diphosphate-sugar epimerase